MVNIVGLKIFCWHYFWLPLILRDLYQLHWQKKAKVGLGGLHSHYFALFLLHLYTAGLPSTPSSLPAIFLFRPFMCICFSTIK